MSDTSPPDTITITGGLIPVDGRLDLSLTAILTAAERLEAAGVPATDRDFHARVLDVLGVPPATDDTPLRRIGTLGNRHVAEVLRAYRAGARASGVVDDGGRSGDAGAA